MLAFCASRRSHVAFRTRMAAATASMIFKDSMYTSSARPSRRTHAPRTLGLASQRRGHRRLRCSAAVQSTVSELLKLCDRTDRGVNTSAGDREALLQHVERLQESQKGKSFTGSSLSARWRLIWTTEKVHH